MQIVPTEKKASIEKSSEIGILLGYYGHLDALSTDALKQERARAQKASSEFNNPTHRLRLAMILSLSEPGSLDYRQALELLKTAAEAGEKQDPTLSDFSRFLAASLHRLKIQNEHNQKLGRMLNEQDVRYQALLDRKKKQDNRVGSLTKKLKKEATRSRHFEKIIEELKTIEKNIMKRENEKPNE
ncbi:hypothetical protein JYT92_00095 [bacterium AH-315-L15]|nr:hypothetical protein [bacterium AH-315-L15]